MDHYHLHPWNVNTVEAKHIQRTLRERLFKGKPLALNKVKRLAAADLAFSEGKAFAVVAVFKFPSLELIEVQKASKKIAFPYVPGLLTFREGPCLIDAFEKIKNEPDVIIFDGQGEAHPERMGIATHMGILFDKPSIGCAKSRLIGIYKEPKKAAGSYTPLFYNEGVVGAVLRTRDGVKPLFISPGFKIDLESSIKIVLSCCKGKRNPEPIRYVDSESKKMAKNH